MKKRVTHLLLAVASLAMALVTLPAHAAPTQLQPNVTHSSGQLRIQGILVSQGKAVVGGSLTASIDGATAASATTDAAGGYDFAADISKLSDGNHELQIAFAGLGEAEAAQWSATISVTGAGSQASTQNAEQVGGQATTLTLSGPAEARSGDVIELKGSVAGANGAAIANAGVSIFDATGEVANSFTITAANGSFSTLYMIPEEQDNGTLVITAEFPGGNGLSAAKATHTINVSKAQIIDPSATPSGEAATAPSLDTTASATAAPSLSTTAKQTTATPPQNVNILPWILLGLAAAGGLGLTVAAGLILRRRNQASREAVTSSLVLIEEAAEEAVEPETTTDDVPQVAEPSEPQIAEPVQPNAAPAIATPIQQESATAPAPIPHRAATDLPPAPRRSDDPAPLETVPSRGLPADATAEAKPLREWSDWAEEPPTTPRRGL